MKRISIIVTAAVALAVIAAVLLNGSVNNGTAHTAFASRLLGIAGAGSSGIQVQNLSTTGPANIVADFYPQSGGPKIPLTRVAGPGAAANFYLPGESALSDGAYAVVVSADQLIGAIARTDWGSSGGAAIYGSVPPASSVLVPLVVRAYVNQYSMISVQNTDTTASANVTINILPRGSSTPAKTVTASIPPGTSHTWDLNSTDFSGLPNTGADLGVPTGFLGAASVTADKPIVVQAFTDVAGAKAVGGFSGVPSSAASTTLYAPLIRRNYFGTTGLQIVNLNGTAANVTVSYHADPSSPTGGNFTDNVTIQPNSSQAIYHGSSAQTHVPDHWFGNAVIQSNMPVVAMVNDTTGSGANASAGSYNAPTQADASTKVALPLVRRKHTSTVLTTGVQVMNVGSGPANITIQFTGWDGAPAGSLTQNNVAQSGAVNWYQAHPSSPVPSSGRPEGGWYGSAVITSSQPVVVIVNDASDINAVDSAIYNGLPSQ